MLEWTPDDLHKILEEGKDVFLKLWKPGCGPCKLSEPAVRRLEEAYVDKFIFGQIDAHEFSEILEIADTDVLPVFFIFKNKKMLGRSIGFKGQAKLQEFVESFK